MAPSTENIATFVEVVRRHSLSAAARHLELPKSTVSRRLLRLEQQLDAKLLHRDARRVTMTPAGRSFYESVFGAVDTLASAVSELQRDSQQPSGTIRITAAPDLGRMVLAPMLVAFLKRYPDISLDLSLSNHFADLVQEGIDLALRAGRVTQAELFARRLCAAELQLAVGGELASSAQSLDEDVRSLERSPFVLHRATGRTQTIRLEQSVGKRRRSLELNVSGRINVDDYATMVELVSAGQGIGLMPSLHVRDGVRTGRLARVLPDWGSRASHIYLVSASRKQPERVRLLAEFLVQAFADIASV